MLNEQMTESRRYRGWIRFNDILHFRL